MAESNLVQMKPSANFEFDDLQALFRFGNGQLTETSFMLLQVKDADTARQWLSAAPVSSATATRAPPDTSLQIAFSAEGLRAMGLRENIIKDFSDEFITGLAGDESRSRRLGDTGANAPEHWQWGGEFDQTPHILLMLYARKGTLDDWKKTIENELFSRAFQLLRTLPTVELEATEPFGFIDGISQPKIDWAQQQSTDLHERDRYSNQLVVGEVVLGYRNEYGHYTPRPLIDPKQDPQACSLPKAEDEPAMRDFGRNGSYLVLRQLHQDVPGFWQFIDVASDSDPEKREQLAASMVGRERDGTPLAPGTPNHIPGIPWQSHNNHFTYELDAAGTRCPVGAHIRRSNPRTGDYPPGVSGFVSRIIKALGFGKGRPDEDLIASARFHRLLRRGRSYGPRISPEDAIKPDAPTSERGLQFICLVANISRQFEFVQNAWNISSKFGGVQNERDPLLGIREPLLNGAHTDHFNHPQPTGPMQTTCHLPQFITVHGGGYFFMPGLRALQYIAATPATDGDSNS